jgi:16S rRNA C967 or C1407 C5-methylase (RsmB/RsmF family)/NOL1/NOP2/fmu family ribosome biogenesis protein
MNFPEAHRQTVSEILGEEFPLWEKAYSTQVPVSIRVNPLKWKGIFPTEKVAWSETGFYLPERPSFTHDPFFHAGCYYVQEASSMSIEQVFKQHVNANDALTVLDLCAAPGGKSTLMHSLMNEQSILVSNEVIRTRANILAENISKWGKTNAIVTNADPERFASLPDTFDLILADAPCSGEGLFRRDPEAAKEWSPANVDLCSARQKRILLDIWPSLKEEGLLVYSTCTFNRQENEANLLWLKKQCEFESVRMEFPPDWGIVETETEGIFAYRFYPHRVKGEGFFLAVLRKKENTASASSRFKANLQMASKNEKALVASYIKQADAFDFFIHSNHVLAFRKTVSQEMQRIIQQLPVVQSGIQLAAMEKGMKPLHELALSVELNRSAFTETKLDKENALRFLAKEDVRITGGKGISLVTYEDTPLGWLNLLGNRANNLYPKEWRIRKL